MSKQTTNYITKTKCLSRLKNILPNLHTQFINYTISSWCTIIVLYYIVVLFHKRKKNESFYINRIFYK